jgi:multidrug efflux pump subunit AcrA (membrane-fusion protein)
VKTVDNPRRLSSVSSPPSFLPKGEGRSSRRTKHRQGKRPLLFVLSAVVMGIGVALWQWWTRHDAEMTDPATTTTRVIRRDFTSSVLATGAVRPQVGAEVRVGARISGKVEKLRANIGDSVNAGQVIAELEKADLRAMVDQRRAERDLSKAKLSSVESLLPQEIAKAKADYMRSQASLTLKEQGRKRAEQLHDANARLQKTDDKLVVISDTEYDQAVANYEMDKAQLASARQLYELAKTHYVEQRKQAAADLARAEAALDNAKVTLSYATLTAPISGVIGSVSTQEGETVAAGLNSPTFVTIIDLNRLQVDAMVDEVDIGKVHPGQKAVFTVDSFPAREFPGKVVAIYPKAVLLENVVYYDVVIEIQGNEDKVLRPEMTASATIFLDLKTGVLAIPVKAVKRERGKNVVYVVKNGQTQTREVKVGWKDGAWIEVVAGLKEGETILQAAPADQATTHSAKAQEDD